ncbi:hypothetical protein SVAN01_01279 [Stagonosporopsis vannaccii]|nr:hypothetical protein SVAN01_01279 [Stagonosporopsis vannaccii]
MAPNAYQKFSRHATPHLRVARYWWTAKERRATILTVYHTEPAVRQYYASNDMEFPTLSTLFPGEPYTSAHVIEARSHGLKPTELIALQIPLTRPTTLPVNQTRQPVTPVAAAPAASSPDYPPYKHWSPYPWGPEPILPPIGAGMYIPLPDKDRFLGTDPHMPGDEDHWRGVNFLGSGSYGAVGLWCKVDEHENVIDRMVVKDNAALNRAAWRDPKNWRDGLPREIAVNRRIESRRIEEPEACQYIVKYRGHRLLMEQRRFRLYANFAAGGNLTAAMMPYDRRWEKIKPEHVPVQRHLPEAFIWHFIKALATACLVLETGTLGDAPVDNWKPVFHLDFQTPNILLDLQAKKRKAPADGESQHTPADPGKTLKKRKADLQNLEIVPKLADFGLSFFDLDFSKCPALDENPEDHVLTENESRYAPEHHHYNPDSPKKLDTKTDVWGIGRVAWGLIVNRLEPDGPVRENGFLDEIYGNPLPLSQNDYQNMQVDDQYRQQVLIGSSEWPASIHYSEELKELVRDCLKFYQQDRPTPKVILDRVKRHLDANPHLKEGAMDADSTLLEFPYHRGQEIGERFKRKPVT